MQLFELLLIISSVSLLIIVTLGKKKWRAICLVLGISFLLLHLVFETVRWQMGLCLLVFLLTSIAVLIPGRSKLLVRLLGLSMGLLLIGISGFYAHYMPIVSLPKPSGNFTVGNMNLTLKDRTREETHTSDPVDFRELFVEIWYPADSAFLDQSPLNTLWQELYRGDSDIVNFFTRYMSGIDTHSYFNIQPLRDKGTFPLILFNHGLQMFTSQNTLLMEELASHGYVVVSVGHPYESIRVNLADRTVLPEFIHNWDNFKQAMQWIQQSSAPIIAAKDSIAQIANSQRRIQIARNAISNSEMNQIVSEWTADTRFVLDKLVATADFNIPPSSLIDTTRIGVMGMSIGGATSAEFCKTDRRVKAGINIDGLLYGNHQQVGLKMPFLTINSQDDMGLNQFLIPEIHHNYHQVTFAKARHSDFTDMIYVWPIMKLYGQSGTIAATRMIHLTNKVVLNFWDHYLKDKEIESWSNIPEIQVKQLTPTLNETPQIIQVLQTSQ